MNVARKYFRSSFIFFALSFFSAQCVSADIVTEWNVRACEVVTAANVPTPYANRAMAIMHTAIYYAVNAITHKYKTVDIGLEASGASVEAATAAAGRVVLLDLYPAQKEMIENAYGTALMKVPDGKARADGIALGEAAAKAVLSARRNDGAFVPDSYRPKTTAGVYVLTATPLVTNWPLRTPWLMNSPSQFRPGPPPALTSDAWARDYNELKNFGGKEGSQRTADQTEIARFWETTGPTIYHAVLRSVGDAPGRDVTQNARFFAAATQAIDDAMIAVFDAKYHYNFWRPITAIRNGDIDGNDATERVPTWTPLINTPMHPEYPCAHCVVGGAVGAVIKAEIGSGSMPVLTAVSPTATKGPRSWSNVQDMMREVENGRVYDGVHFRTSAEAGTAIGKKVGELAAEKFFH